MYEIFVDGACSGNPGMGGWGAIVRHPSGREVEFNGAEPYTTNNRMELLGAIVALESLKSNQAQRVLVTSDSQYLIKGASEWMSGWEKKGWRNSKRELVPNLDLWQRLRRLKAQHAITWVWVRGHNGHPENERCDRLAKKAILEVSCVKGSS